MLPSSSWYGAGPRVLGTGWLCCSSGSGAGELLGFGSCQRWVHLFVPLLVVLGSEFGDVLHVTRHIPLTCPTSVPSAVVGRSMGLVCVPWAGVFCLGPSAWARGH